MNEEDIDGPVDDGEQMLHLSTPRQSGKNSILNSDHWQPTVMNQRRANMPTTGYVPDFSYDAYTPAHPIDTFSAPPRRPDFEKIRDHLVEDLEHVFTYDEKFGDVIAMPKAVAQMLLNYLNWELRSETATRSPNHPVNVLQVLDRMQSWINMGPSQSEIQSLQARMPRSMEQNMYPLIKLLDMLHEAGMLR